jgi:hypothetical protein
MPVGKSVQFRGIDKAVEAYTNQAIPKWGLFQGSQFLSKYDGNSLSEGAELLESFLTALDLRTADSATYTLCVYDDLAPGEKIKSSTKYDGSFNFRLVDNIEPYQQNKMGGVYEQRIAGLEQRILELSAEPVEPELTTGEKLMGALGKVLEHPQIQELVASKLIGVIDGVGNVLTGIFKSPAVAIGNIPSAPLQQTNEADENAKLQEAIRILITVDSQLGTHLLTLAKVAKADPSKYNSLIGMLNLL